MRKFSGPPGAAIKEPRPSPPPPVPAPTPAPSLPAAAQASAEGSSSRSAPAPRPPQPPGWRHPPLALRPHDLQLFAPHLGAPRRRAHAALALLMPRWHPEGRASWRLRLRPLGAPPAPQPRTQSPWCGSPCKGKDE